MDLPLGSTGQKQTSQRHRAALANVRSGVCYVGLSYKQQPKDGDIRHACCAAQMFLSDGEGVVFRGALGPWYQPDSKQFHLDRPAAQKLASTMLGEYRLRHPNDPVELFIHAKSSFSDDEWDSFVEACQRKQTNVVGVRISDAWDQLKLYRPGSYPTIRGTACSPTIGRAFFGGELPDPELCDGSTPSYTARSSNTPTPPVSPRLPCADSPMTSWHDIRLMTRTGTGTIAKT